MAIDEAKLKELVTIADHVRTIYLRLPTPTYEMTEYGVNTDPMYEQIRQANLDCERANANLINYLLEAFGMQAEILR